jgi:hypothetical protein
MRREWTGQRRIEAFVKITGASENEAIDYLVAEEGDIRSAVISYRGDKQLAQESEKWRDLAVKNAHYAETARYTASVAIFHLQSVLNKAKTPAEQQESEKAARDWLVFDRV